jgi:hypothetical protein
MAGERTFVVKFISDTAGAVSGFGKLSGGLKGLQKSVSNSIPGFALLAAGATAALGGITAGLVGAVKAAMEDQKSQAELQRQLEKTFGANEALTESAERYISVTQLRTGTSDTELRASLGTLVRATGDLTKSQDLLNLAQDISIATGRDLASVSIALSRASQGQFTALSRLGIPLDDATKKSKDFDKVLGLLNDQFGGAAEAAANTFGGQLKILGGQFGEIVESIGAALLPYLERFSKFLVDNVAPAVQRIVTVMGEKGLVGAFQQLIFESGNAGPKVISVFKAITLGAANAINVLAKAFFITSATFKLTTRDFVGAAKDFYKATQNFIDVGSVSKQFDSVAKGIDNYAVRGIPSAIRAQQGLKGSVEELTGDDTSGLKGATKAIVTAEQKLKSYGDSLKKSTSLQLRFSDAQKSEKKSLATLTDANNDLASAKAKLAQIERGFGVGSPEALAAQAELAKAQRAQERAVYAVEEAVFSVADAEKNLAEIRKDPESSAMDIRRAEINLAEAKLSVADATDSQAESTKELNDQQRLLNDAIFGATVGSILYDQALRDVEDATRQQVSAYEAWEEAVTNTKNAQDDFNASLQATADLIRKYPKVLGGMPNPMANLVPDSTLANNAGSLFNGGGMGNVNIEVNAGLGASGIEVGQEIEQYLKEYLNFTGGQFSFGSIGSIF